MFVGFGKFLLLVELQTGRSGPCPAGSGQEKNGGGGSNRALLFRSAAGRLWSLAVIDQKREREKQNRGRKRPLVRLGRPARQPCADVATPHVGQRGAAE